jgi:hypothetical protein
MNVMIVYFQVIFFWKCFIEDAECEPPMWCMGKAF